MKKKAEYQGWSNYETWAVALWINNDQGLYEMFKEDVEQMRSDGSSDLAEEGSYSDIVVNMADNMQGFFEEQVEGLNLEGVFADLMNRAMSEVDWREIAKDFISE